MSNILFVFEGEKTEEQLVNSLTKFFFNEKTLVKCAFCAEIYQLHKAIATDSDLDTFTLLKEIPQNKEILREFNRDDFAEIYLFFDYDGHSTLADDDSLEEMLGLFNEETESGKLLISYPMVESLKHLSEEIDFKLLKVSAKENIKYKQIVGAECDNQYLQFSKYSKETWRKLLENHLKKMNYIINNEFQFPDNNYSQHIIFKNQRNKYINIDSTVAVLSGFPVFIFDYYGSENMIQIVFKD
ncbi:hypothetical protein [Flavobacterium sp.]|uniref:hypothetical protein n=1 Tax=Flavobacterium sp. TaxID=239 RepID=UPI00391AFA5F